MLRLVTKVLIGVAGVTAATTGVLAYQDIQRKKLEEAQAQDLVNTMLKNNGINLNLNITEDDEIEK